MQHTLVYNPPGSLDVGPSSTFNVVIAYEDFETGKHAKHTYDFLVEHLGRESQFTNQMWKFDILRIPKLREIATKDALDADIIIVSSRGDDDLPAPVKSWIESWLTEPGHALALVALFSGPREEAPARRCIRAYLAAAARRGKMEFFAQPDDWPGRENQRESFILQRNADLGQKTLSALAGAIQLDPVPASRWNLDD